MNTYCDTMADDNYTRDEEDFDEEEVDETVSLAMSGFGDAAVYMRKLPTDSRFDGRATDQSKMLSYLQSILAAQC